MSKYLITGYKLSSGTLQNGTAWQKYYLSCNPQDDQDRKGITGIYTETYGLSYSKSSQIIKNGNVNDLVGKVCQFSWSKYNDSQHKPIIESIEILNEQPRK